MFMFASNNKTVSVSPSAAWFKGRIRINQKVPRAHCVPPRVGTAVVPTEGGARAQQRTQRAGGHLHGSSSEREKGHALSCPPSAHAHARTRTHGARCLRKSSIGARNRVNDQGVSRLCESRGNRAGLGLQESQGGELGARS